MATKTVRYTATLPLEYVNALKGFAKEKGIPSVDYAINMALDMYIRELKAADCTAQMKNAGKDEAFLSRTLNCVNDFSALDGEVDGKW